MSGRSQIGDVGLIHPKGNGRVYALLSPRNAVHDVMHVPQWTRYTLPCNPFPAFIELPVGGSPHLR